MQKLNAEQLVEVKNLMAAGMLVLSGQFDESIAKLDAKLKELKAQEGIAKTVEEAAKIRSDAESYSRSIRAQADKALSDARDKLDKAQKQIETLTTAEKSLAEDRKAVDNAKQKLQSDQSVLAAETAKHNRAVAEFNTFARSKTQELDNWGRRLAEERQKLDAKIRQIREVA